MRKIIKNFTLSLVFLATLNISYAQTKEVSGKVMDASGKAIAGASVIAKGTKIGTSTDDNGQFSIPVASDTKSLLVSALNYASQDIPITVSPITIILKSTVVDLEEVIVVGYGTQKVTKVSGAISTIKETDIEKLKPVRVEDVLQGRASGVTVISNGSPGSKPTVLIRGIPSFSGTDPVVIIDGIPQTLDDFNAVNSEDIATISVLKDAAATAIYGVKGGNGVIVVTTKSGRRNQKTEISVNGNYGVQEVMNIIPVLIASEYAAIINEGSVAAGGNLVFLDLSVIRI